MEGLGAQRAVLEGRGPTAVTRGAMVETAGKVAAAEAKAGGPSSTRRNCTCSCEAIVNLAGTVRMCG